MSLRHIDWNAQAASARDYLCVDAFLADMVGARALATAFETKVIDCLQKKEQTGTMLEQVLGLDTHGLQLLLEMLEAHGVIQQGGTGAWRLSSAFEHALAYRDLLEAKLYFAGLVAHDYLHLATALLMEPQRFFEQARVFSLFSYDRACAPGAENMEHTARWMRITTALTAYEAAACLAGFDFSPHRRMLDVGGNSGELVRRICTAMPELEATVYDLPHVCDIGRRHVDDQSPAEVAKRIRFVKRDQDRPSFPEGHDLIVFKSMLHDWPEQHARNFLQRAFDALPAGGTLLIFERQQTPLAGKQIAYGQLPLMLFFRSYRRPDGYAAWLSEIGFQDASWQEVPLDMPFMLLTARKPG